MEYSLKLSQQEIHMVRMAIAELPIKVAINLFISIDAQIADQDKSSAVQIGELSQVKPSEDG